jgi:hypothetical protein
MSQVSNDEVPTHRPQSRNEGRKARSATDLCSLGQTHLCQRRRSKIHSGPPNVRQGNRPNTTENLQVPALRRMAPHEQTALGETESAARNSISRSLIRILAHHDAPYIRPVRLGMFFIFFASSRPAIFAPSWEPRYLSDRFGDC